MKKLILSCLLLIISFGLVAQTDTVLLEDLRYQWVYLNEGETTPATGTSGIELVSFNTVLKENQIIKICNDEPYDIWVNLRMFKHQVSSCVSLQLEDFEELPSDTLNIQISGPRGLTSLTTELNHVVAIESDDLEIEYKSGNSLRDYYLISLLILLVFGAILRRYYTIRFDKLFSNPLAIRRRSSYDDFYPDFFSADNILILLYLAYLVAVPVVYINYRVQLIGSGISFGGLMAEQLFFTGLVAILILGKHLISVILSSFFKFREVSNIQNQDFMNYFSWVALFILLITVLDLAYLVLNSSSWFSFIGYILTFSVAIFQLISYFKIDRVTSLKKIMIISYLCTTEFLPGFILIYLLIK
ncbi:DUF4271 domain-containing protein [Marinoscillum sp. MHG1-6]|uniref:DUF4271 domain-containing protein n=1 Tax=Marinoscillum sp. MHG1-6 TaxID=2959627 RepID=UPI00215781ED|nr:DUF4271 domain-containing protein [Marinoscillum sp. MHG1-6]